MIHARLIDIVWQAAADAQAAAKEDAAGEQLRVANEARRLKEEIRRHSSGAS